MTIYPFNHADIKKTDKNSFLVQKPDGIVELKESDYACPPGTVGGLRLNSFCVWARLNNNDWVALNERSIIKSLKLCLEADNADNFLRENS